jgi:pimeloyl-ACP methyl ester carboxylesterase
MRTIILIIAILGIEFGSFAQTKDITGLWEGKLNVGVELRIVFQFTKNADGTYKATMDSPDQNAKGIPCNKVTLSGDSVITEISIAQAVYKAAIVNDSTLSGKFEQAGRSLPLVVKHVEKVSAPVGRKQTPKPPFNYNSDDIVYYNADSSLHFGATFTYPKTGGPFTTAILITGSGQQDRDETILNHKPFAVIADYLTSNGYAVLRVDDRAVGKTSFGDVWKATSADFAKDVEAGLAYLNTRKEVNKNKIGLIGHSEGGLIADIVGSRNKNISFIIMLAGPGIDGATVLAGQTEAILVASGGSKETAAAYKSLYQKIISNSKEKDTALAITKSIDDYKQWKKTTDPKIVDTLEMNNDAEALKAIRQMIKQFSIPWFRYFFETDPAYYIRQLQCKVLALCGSKDLQVLPEQNLTAIKSALKKSESKKYETIELPALNHMFQHCNACTIQEYGQLEETFAPEALEIMLKWLNKNIGDK